MMSNFLEMAFIYLFTILSIVFWLYRCDKNKYLVFPNQRSSHHKPIFNGGGITLLLPCLIVWFLHSTNQTEAAQLLIPIAFILSALTGFLDDFHQLNSYKKLLLIHFFTLLLCFAMLENFSLRLWGMNLILNKVYVAPIIFFGMVWLVNLNNFMDGINGLAIFEVIFMFLSVWLSRDSLGLLPEQASFVLYCSVFCCAFVPFNFPHPKVFLGDTGSLLLGVLLVWLFLEVISVNANGLWFFLILFSMFWVDATVTLIRRWLRGESIFMAHREHAYQHLANEVFLSHTKATLSIQLINWFWLFPLALMALNSERQLLWLVFAVLPIIFYVFKLKAGEKWSKRL